MIGLIRRKIWNPMSFFVIRLFGRSLDSVSLSLAICVLAYFGVFFYNQRFIPNIHYLIILIFAIDVLYLTKALWWHFRIGKKAEVLGYLRMDNTIEIHIAGMDSSVVFEKRIRKTMRYAQKHNHLIEYTSGIIPYGELIRRYGDAIVMIKAPGLLDQIMNGTQAASFMKDKPTYNLAHPLKVVLDPKKFGMKYRHQLS
jgi:hypothetical protein